MINIEYWRFAKVKQATALSRSTVFRLERDGLFPKRRQLSPHTVGWLRSEIEAWINSRQEVRSHA